MNKKMYLAGLCLLPFASLSMAQTTVSDPRPISGYVTSSDNHVVRSGTGLCVRTGYYDPSTSFNPECDKVEVAQVTPPPVETPPPPPVVARENEVLKITFAFDNALLSAENRQKIDDFLAHNDAQQKDIEIVAGADFIGTEKYNQRLSVRRAQAIAAYIQSRFADVKPNIVKVDGVGESQANLQNTQECQEVKGNRRKLIACIADDRFGQITIEEK